MSEAILADFLAGFDEGAYPPDFLQRYEPLECLAHTALGETLLVRDRHNDAYAVAKCTAREVRQSRTPEAAVLRRLQRVGLPRYLAEYHTDTLHCVVRSYAPGQSLAQLTREHPLTTSQAVAIALQLCDILTYLHQQTPPIIHRDIKPENVIVDAQGAVTLIDFGISRTYDENAQKDTTCLGTRCYAAPEQYGFAQTDARADIFSLGVLLCWMLTGQVDPQQGCRGIAHPRLARVVARCTAFAPQDRYLTAAQVHSALRLGTTRGRPWFLPAALLLLSALAAIALALFPRPPAGVTFQEPLIEAAVRLSLEKTPEEPITPEELATITELFAFGNEAAGDDASYRDTADRFAHSDQSVTRGSIHSLEDLQQMPNLRRVCLSYQQISDLTPLSALSDLEHVDLRHNPIQSVDPLSGLPRLNMLILFDTGVSDLRRLSSCPRLTFLDVGLTPIRDLEVLKGLDALQTLKICKTPLRSLEGIATHPLLEEIALTETQVLDLTPLLDLPLLRRVEVNEGLRPLAEVLADRAAFEIVYP